MSDEDRWVNAEITITVPIQAPVDEDRYVKQAEVAEVMDAIDLSSLPDAVASGRWVDVRSDPRGGTIPLAPSSVREGGDAERVYKLYRCVITVNGISSPDQRVTRELAVARSRAEHHERAFKGALVEIEEREVRERIAKGPWEVVVGA